MKYMIFISALVTILVYHQAFASGNHIQPDNMSGYFTKDGHYQSDRMGGYYAPNGEHIQSDGRGGFLTKDNGMDAHYPKRHQSAKVVVQ